MGPVTIPRPHLCPFQRLAALGSREREAGGGGTRTPSPRLQGAQRTHTSSRRSRIGTTEHPRKCSAAASTHTNRCRREPEPQTPGRTGPACVRLRPALHSYPVPPRLTDSTDKGPSAGTWATARLPFRELWAGPRRPRWLGREPGPASPTRSLDMRPQPSELERTPGLAVRPFTSAKHPPRPPFIRLLQPGGPS